MLLPTPCKAQGFLLVLLMAAVAHGQNATNGAFALRAQQAFTRAQKEFDAHPDVATNAWQLGRVTYDWADLATNAQQRADVAQIGIDACRQLLARDPNNAPAHYYLARDYGQLAIAEAPSMAAYKLIRDIEREFKSAAELDERMDHAGPLRCLGLLYRDAPGWPISIGSKRKAGEYLQRAAATAPDYPENQLNLVESNIQWHQADDAKTAWLHLARTWPAAQTNFSGPAWKPDWDDWNSRRIAAKEDFQKTFKQSLEP
jgi:tetratricopeptide (TPR) repeat protein